MHETCDAALQEEWLLHRDILHAMTMPLVELYKESSILAAAALCSEIPRELEVAFKGEARFAFLWLQCFITEEEDWCHTRGCPACNTMQTLSTELTIRGAIISALLSAKDNAEPETPSSETGEEQPSLPDFSIILGALEQAMDNDAFWGPGHYTTIFSRSKRIVAGIQELMSIDFSGRFDVVSLADQRLDDEEVVKWLKQQFTRSSEPSDWTTGSFTGKAKAIEAARHRSKA